ncbi:ribonuclease M5 [Peptoniphilus equinus]|uniref:Ribonuclease M5 n=1 Tax=Peptoniphilus equinus TaxID=3016343 RepID=A0ABY7QTW1_9FIRM|nr:ribonuclease M5 [Peptoniphilus equinus]WBW50187.1 ribonuclease M5 [Peptoniphilus equinus]
MIKEVIVVEGKDDIAAVKGALECDVIATHGFGYGYQLIQELQNVQKKRGLIIFTDPDYMGKKIRADIAGKVPGVKHAYLAQDKAMKHDNIGIENAKAKDIIEAIDKARPSFQTLSATFTEKDLHDLGLTGPGSKERRLAVAAELAIGYGNAKAFLNQLNGYGIDPKDLYRAVEKVTHNHGTTL